MIEAFAALHLYFEGLPYTLLLNALGLALMRSAWFGSHLPLGATTHVTSWFFVAIGLVLQIPGVFYLGVGAWAACATPGAAC